MLVCHNADHVEMAWQSRLRQLAARVTNTDYGSRAAVAKHNAAADEIRELIRRVGCSSTADLDTLLSFLSDKVLRSWIAYGVLEQCPTSPSQRKRCVDVIRDLARGEGAEALAARLWLRDNNEAS
jgi:hypothetical protein